MKTRCLLPARHRLVLFVLGLFGCGSGWAQTSLHFAYNTNLGLAGKFRYAHGFSVSLQQSISPKVAIGFSVRHIKNPIAPDPEKATGLPVAGFGIDWFHWPVTGLVDYQLTRKKIKPYVGLETGVFFNHFKANPNGPTLKKNTSFGVIPKVGLRTSSRKISVFAESLYMWQTLRRFQHDFGSATMNPGHVTASFGITFYW